MSAPRPRLSLGRLLGFGLPLALFAALAFMLALHGGVGAACALWLAKRHWGWELNWTRPWWRAAPA